MAIDRVIFEVILEEFLQLTAQEAGETMIDNDRIMWMEVWDKCTEDKQKNMIHNFLYSTYAIKEGLI